MSLYVHCDKETCDTWQRAMGEGWTEVRFTDGDVKHFCTLDCVLTWVAAYSVPTESIPA